MPSGLQLNSGPFLVAPTDNVYDADFQRIRRRREVVKTGDRVLDEVVTVVVLSSERMRPLVCPIDVWNDVGEELLLWASFKVVEDGIDLGLARILGRAAGRAKARRVGGSVH